MQTEQLRFPGLDQGPNLNVAKLTRSHMTPAELALDAAAREYIRNQGPHVSAPLSGIDFHSLKVLLQGFDRGQGNNHLDKSTPTTHRIGYSGESSDVAKRIAAATSYNTPLGEGIGNLNLAHPEAQGYRSAATLYYQDNPTTVIVPMAREPVTGEVAVDYASSMVGGKHVIGITIGLDDQTEEEAKRAADRNGSSHLKQSDILRAINWKALCAEIGIPHTEEDPHLPPSGTKGLTMLSGVLAARVINGHAQNGVAFIDSDIMNNSAGGYDPLAYLALPGVVNPGNDLRAISVARTGPGRNNEMTVNSLNELAYDTDQLDDESRQTAFLLAATNSWALTGERLFPAVDGHSMLFSMPWTTGMSIETQMNLYRAGIELAKRGVQSAQVFNPNPKVERGISDPVREFSMLSRCVDWQVQVLRHASRVGRQLPDFSIADIADFNKSHGAVEQTRYYVSERHAPNTPRVIERDFMLPSVDQMISMGAVNVDALQTYGTR
ncbi:hypothetical protein HYS00_04585 [Candidatus Microgenomates bacterium]|nr:hypothetical protein [Candidatus Microgenomates bacterium]